MPFVDLVRFNLPTKPPVLATFPTIAGHFNEFIVDDNNTLFSGEGINYVTEKTTDRKRAANEYLVHLIDKYILAKVK